MSRYFADLLGLSLQFGLCAGATGTRIRGRLLRFDGRKLAGCVLTVLTLLVIAGCGVALPSSQVPEGVNVVGSVTAQPAQTADAATDVALDSSARSAPRTEQRVVQETPRHRSVRERLAGRAYYLGRYTSTNQFTTSHPGFCNQFLTDWQAQRHITYVDPVVTTNDYHDPALLAYTRRYDGIMRRTVAHYTGIERYKTKAFYAQSGFRIYEGEFDNVLENGAEVVFFADDWAGHSRFHLLRLDANAKLIQEQAIGTPATVRDGVPSQNNMAEVIRYRGYTLIVGMDDYRHPDEGVYAINLYMFGPLLGQKGGLVCRFSQNPISPLDEIFLKEPKEQE